MARVGASGVHADFAQGPRKSGRGSATDQLARLLQATLGEGTRVSRLECFTYAVPAMEASSRGLGPVGRPGAGSGYGLRLRLSRWRR